MKTLDQRTIANLIVFFEQINTINSREFKHMGIKNLAKLIEKLEYRDLNCLTYHLDLKTRQKLTWHCHTQTYKDEKMAGNIDIYMPF